MSLIWKWDAVSLCNCIASPVGCRMGSEVRLRCGLPIPLNQRSQFLQLLLLGTFQILQPPTQQRELSLMLLLWVIGKLSLRPKEEEGGG